MPLIDWKAAAILASAFLIWLTRAFWGPYLKGYAEEKGKRLATQEDIENVLAQLRAITAETKAIEAKISGAEWDRQWLQTERIERYAEYLGKVHNVGSSGRDYAVALQVGGSVDVAAGTYMRAMDELRVAEQFVRMLSGPELKAGFSLVCEAVNSLARALYARQAGEAQAILVRVLPGAITQFTHAVRSEIVPGWVPLDEVSSR